MANNYEQATLSPTIPELTVAEKLIMEASGFGLEDDEGGFYAYIEECLCDDVHMMIEAEDALLVRESEYKEKFEDVDSTGLWVDVLQNVLRRHPDISYFVLEGAWTCSRMRPGEFGGFVIFITRDTVKHGSTSQLIRDWEKELGL